jgi:hypothetical protein
LSRAIAKIISIRRLIQKLLSIEGRACHSIRYVIVLAALFFAGGTNAATNVSGAVTANSVWSVENSPYIITGDVLIQNGATLAIKAGVTIFMAQGTSLTVQSGALQALGTVQLPIRFTSKKILDGQQSVPGDWQHVGFGSGISNSTKLEYVSIEYGSGVVVSSASPVFNNVTISNNKGAAITADLASSITGYGNQAIGNDENAVVVPEGDIATSVNWGLKGIPYLVSGTISVGVSPKINSISPKELQQGDIQTISISGSRLTGFASPEFDVQGLTGQVLAGATDTQVQVQVTASAATGAGAARLKAVVDAGEINYPNALNIVVTQPRLSSVLPTTIATGAGDSIISLKGQNFSAQSVAYLDDAALATTYVNPTELSATVPNQTASGTKRIELRTPRTNGAADFVSNALAINVITLPPTIDSVAPGSLRRGETKNMQIVGANLSAVTVTTTDAGLQISEIALSATKATFKLTALANATLGKQSIKLTNSAGSASVQVSVNPVLPTASVTPTPIAVPPDGSPRQFAIQLSYPDTVEHQFFVSVADQSVVQVSTLSLSIEAGKVQVIGSLSGLKSGVTSLTLTSATLGTLSVPIYVTADFLGLNTSNASLLGVVFGEVTEQPNSLSVSPVSNSVGVVFGNAVYDVSPKAVAVDSGSTTLTISGEGLQAATSIAVVPSDGITLGNMAIAADGKSISVPIVISPDAPATQRRVALASASGPYRAIRPDSDRLTITQPRPELLSVDPLFGIPGTSSLSVTIRGRNLQSVDDIDSQPSDGVSFGTSPTISADGTQINAVMNIASTAAVGPRAIVVRTPTAASDTAPTSFNTFTIVNSIDQSLGPISAPILGVIKADTASPNETPVGLNSPFLGVNFGAAVTEVIPSAKAIGETFTLTLRGIGLQNISQVVFSPNTGLTVGTPTPEPDGLSVSVQVSISADAPLTSRTIQVMAGTTKMAFSQPSTAIFNVTAPQPEIDSTEPIVLQIGMAPIVMTVRGRNLQGAQSVRFIPGSDMTVSATPTVNSAGTEVVVSVSAASTALMGPRAVVVTTPGGETSKEMGLANTVTLGNSFSTTGLVAPLLGVVLDSETLPAQTSYGPIVSPNLGVAFSGSDSPDTVSAWATSRQLGVTQGAAAYSVTPAAAYTAEDATLSIDGTSLGDVTAVDILPSQGITIGFPLQISSDGTKVSVPISIAADADLTKRQITLSSSTGVVRFADASYSTLQIATKSQESLLSISPILANRGSVVTLVVRGQGLQYANAVIASPSEGLVFDTAPIVSSDGTQLTVNVYVTNGAALGPHVIQVVGPGQSSSGEPSSANTFTVYAQ